MGGAGPHNLHLNRQRLALKLVFQRAGAVCPYRGSAGWEGQISFKCYTCVLSCNARAKDSLYLVLIFGHIFQQTINRVDSRLLESHRLCKDTLCLIYSKNKQTNLTGYLLPT